MRSVAEVEGLVRRLHTLRDTGVLRCRDVQGLWPWWHGSVRLLFPESHWGAQVLECMGPVAMVVGRW